MSDVVIVCDCGSSEGVKTEKFKEGGTERSLYFCSSCSLRRHKWATKLQRRRREVLLEIGLEEKQRASRFYKEEGDYFVREKKELEKDKAIVVDFVRTVKSDQKAGAKWLIIQRHENIDYHLANIWENYREVTERHVLLQDIMYVGNKMVITPRMLDEELRGARNIWEVQHAIDNLTLQAGKKEWDAKHELRQELLHTPHTTTISTVEKCMMKAYDQAMNVGDLYSKLQQLAEESMMDKSKMLKYIRLLSEQDAKISDLEEQGRKKDKEIDGLLHQVADLKEQVKTKDEKVEKLIAALPAAPRTQVAVAAPRTQVAVAAPRTQVAPAAPRTQVAPAAFVPRVAIPFMPQSMGVPFMQQGMGVPFMPYMQQTTMPSSFNQQPSPDIVTSSRVKRPRRPRHCKVCGEQRCPGSRNRSDCKNRDQGEVVDLSGEGNEMEEGNE